MIIIYSDVFDLNFTIQFIEYYKWLPSIILDFVLSVGSMYNKYLNNEK